MAHRASLKAIPTPRLIPFVTMRDPRMMLSAKSDAEIEKQSAQRKQPKKRPKEQRKSENENTRKKRSANRAKGMIEDFFYFNQKMIIYGSLINH